MKDLHQIASRHYAFEGQCFVAAAGCVLSRGEVLAGARSLAGDTSAALELLESMPGADDDLLLGGGSAVIGPDAEYLAGPLQGERGIVRATLDPARLAEGRLAIDTDGHYSRPDVFRLTVNEAPQTGVVFDEEPPQ